MTRSATPLSDLLDAASMGVLPTRNEVDKLAVPPGRNEVAFRSAVRSQARLVHDARSSGNNAAARALARQFSEEYSSGFDGDVLPASDSADPAELAARVRRVW